MGVNLSAARSLEEGLEETLTLHKLNVPVPLRKTLRTTNPIESVFDTVRTVCRNVKCWRPGRPTRTLDLLRLVVRRREIPSHRRLSRTP